MVTDRNRRTPLGKCALIPANTEVVRAAYSVLGNDLERLQALVGGKQSNEQQLMRIASYTSYRAMFRKSSGPLLGVYASKPKRGCLSANKGTREARLSRVIAQPGRHLSTQVSPMRQTSGGAAVVVRGWESQPHGEGRQAVSFWTTEGFTNREGSR